MPDWLRWIMLAVFLVHLCVFVRLLLVRRDRYYVMVCATFFLLVVAFALALAAPQATLVGVSVYWYPRIAAWFCAAISLGWFVRRRLRRRRLTHA